MNGINLLEGVKAYGVRTPLIQLGDDLKKIVFDSVMEKTGGKLPPKSIIAITEAVVAMAQNNVVPPEAVAREIERMFEGADRLVIVDPIQSRNRFSDVLAAIAKAENLSRVDIVLTCPSDEVGNPLLDEMRLDDAGFNFAEDILTEEEYVKLFGEPCHPFTEVNYFDLYRKCVEKCGKEVNIYICTQYAFSKLPEKLGCKDYLVASIHRKELSKKRLLKGGAERVFDLSDILKEPVPGFAGYNAEYGCYGTNKMDDEGTFKLLPRDGFKFVSEVQAMFKEKIGLDVEVMIYGDGAFKDPVGHIWELADPAVSMGHTSGLNGKPKEVKIKYLVANNKDKTPEEQERIIAEALAQRQASDDESTMLAQGTTPRRITDLVGSLCDLVSGSGKRQTPVVIIEHYLD